MIGKRPYAGVHRKEYKEKILGNAVQIKAEDKPDTWTEDARDIINKLLQRKEDLRLGNKGPQSVKDHPWFKDIIWEDLMNKKVTPRFTPASVILFSKLRLRIILMKPIWNLLK